MYACMDTDIHIYNKTGRQKERQTKSQRDRQTNRQRQTHIKTD